jgi:hypothetical protein
MNKTLTLSCLLATLAGCSSTTPTTASPMSPTASSSGFMQDALPTAIQVPTGNRVAMQTVGTGEIAYQCREKQGAAGTYEWVFLGPNAILSSRAGARVGSYYGPPATWESIDGSKLTASQVAVAPAGAGNIPYQLVKANPATGQGAMSGITYIQRVATKGGVAPAAVCDASSSGRSSTAKYQADYIFWSAP